MSRLYPCVYCTEDGYCKKYSDDEVTSWCAQSPCKDEKPSNADRIRGMTDEELADWLGVYCNGQTAQEAGKPCISGMGSCEECWLDWLKQEVSTDG